jgi:hypothetical protein
MERGQKMEKKKIKKIQFKDIVYTDTYNPEDVKQTNRTYRYIVDTQGVERLCVEEEIYDEKENEE